MPTTNPIIEIVKVQVLAKEERESRQKVRLFFFPEDEGVLENLVYGRHNRPSRALRALVPVALQQAYTMGFEAEVGEQPIHWSRYAGCNMCPCSPGFWIKGAAWQDIYVTYRTSEPKPEGLADAVARAAVALQGVTPRRTGARDA